MKATTSQQTVRIEVELPLASTWLLQLHGAALRLRQHSLNARTTDAQREDATRAERLDEIAGVVKDALAGILPPALDDDGAEQYLSGLSTLGVNVRKANELDANEDGSKWW